MCATCGAADLAGFLQETGIFPDTDTDWKAFLEVQRLVLKNTGRLYAPPSSC